MIDLHLNDSMQGWCFAASVTYLKTGSNRTHTNVYLVIAQPSAERVHTLSSANNTDRAYAGSKFVVEPVIMVMRACVISSPVSDSGGSGLSA